MTDEPHGTSIQQVVEIERDRQKDVSGAFAFFCWLGAGGIHLWREPVGHLLSWQGVAYFIVGSFAAAVIFGWLLYGMYRLALRLVAPAQKKVWSKTGQFSRALDVLTVGLGYLARGIVGVLIYFVSRPVFQWLYAS